MDSTERELRTQARTDPDAKLVLADYLLENGREWESVEQRLEVAAIPVKAHPDEDPPRLAFAKVCEELGLHDRAKWIRSACALDRLAPCPDWCDHDPRRCDRTRLSREIQKITEKDGNLLWNPRSPARWFTAPGLLGHRHENTLYVHRGFIDTVFALPNAWLANAPFLLGQHPVRDVHLWGLPELDIGNVRGPNHSRPCRLRGVRGRGFQGDAGEYPWLVIGYLEYVELVPARTAGELLRHEFPGVNFHFH